jgi:adenine-specific DNA-methyltransferase
MQNLLDDLKGLLAQDERLVVEGELIKNKIIELALQLDPGLIKTLLSSQSTKTHFFQDVDGVLVFDKIKFQRFISNKAFLPESYTAFKNKIGLVNEEGEYFSESKEVVLVWPYKDCLLQGGMTKEDQKREEIFYNETLAPDEITRLLDPKVFTNFKLIDKTGEHKLKEFKRDEKGNIKNNLVIKGNNLLALVSLKKEFTGKVKLIYIDPPFNTNSAANTFGYNNSFQHSTWLSFMKKRLEEAKKLLSKDGIMVVAIDHVELFYLGVLMDEIFGRDNRMGVIAVVHNPGGRQDDKFFPTAHENMLFYAKDINLAKLNTLGQSDSKIAQFNLSDKYGKYKLRGFRRSGNNSLRKDRPGLFYPIYYNSTTSEFALDKKKGFIEILPIDEKGVERCWRWGANTFIEKIKKYIEVKKTKNGYDLYIKEREGDYQGEKAKTVWNESNYTGQTGTSELKAIFGDKVFSYPKSPYLMRDVIQISTDQGDLVVDFFGGSGTTSAVAHQMKRQYITIEQMDYVESITKTRILKTLKKEDEGFVYMELAKWNEGWIEKINKAKSAKEVAQIWTEVKTLPFLSYKVDPKIIDANAKEFSELSIGDQKTFLIECLDKNQVYINLSEIEDKDHKITNEDKKLNYQFYSLRS